MAGGGEENRTPVRKHIHPSFSECRLWSRFPLILLHNQSYIIGVISGGRGGGKPDMAQGGGSDASKIDDALAKVDEIVAEQIK